MRTDEELREIHKESSYHREDLEASKVCGCFFCLNLFSPKDIEEWIDKEQTALCPHCGIDSVLSDQYIDEETLVQMRNMWFLTCYDENGKEYKVKY